MCVHKAMEGTDPHTGPMMKSECGMIPVKYLPVIGGRGPSVNTPQQDTAQYSDKGVMSSYICTNEQIYQLVSIDYKMSRYM